MNNSKATLPRVKGDVTIIAASGLNPFLARQIRDALQGFACTATIQNTKGIAANARSLLELLLLGASEGDRLTVCCEGPDAHAAHDALSSALGGRGGGI